MKKKQLTVRLITVVDIQYEQLAAQAKMTKAAYIEDVLNKHAIQKEKEDNVLSVVKQTNEMVSEMASVLEGVLEFVVEKNKQQ